MQLPSCPRPDRPHRPHRSQSIKAPPSLPQRPPLCALPALGPAARASSVLNVCCPILSASAPPAVPMQPSRPRREISPPGPPGRAAAGSRPLQSPPAGRLATAKKKKSGGSWRAVWLALCLLSAAGEGGPGDSNSQTTERLISKCSCGRKPGMCHCSLETKC